MCMRWVFFHLLFLFSATVLATNWQRVYTNPMGESYVDVNNLQKRNNVVYYSRLFDYTQPSPIGVNSSVSQFTVDCIGEKITWLSSKYYKERMGKGEIIKEGNFNRRMFPRPDTVDYITMKFVCNYKQLNTYYQGKIMRSSYLQKNYKRLPNILFASNQDWKIKVRPALRSYKKVLLFDNVLFELESNWNYQDFSTVTCILRLFLAG